MNLFEFPILVPFQDKNSESRYNSERGNPGVDLKVPGGTGLYLPIKTRVIMVSNHFTMGHAIHLMDEQDNHLVFGHLNSSKADVGDQIAPNQIFAISGGSGTDMGFPRLHFEVIAKEPAPGLEHMERNLAWIDGYNLDPIKYLGQITDFSSTNSSIAWAKEKGLMKQEHKSDTPVTWADFSQALKRLHENKQDRP